MKSILFSLALLSLSFSHLCAGETSLNFENHFATAAERKQNQYQAILETYIDPNTPGAAVIVSQKGQVLFEGAAGLANMELSVAVTPQSVFQLGSITKQFTAAAIMMLQEQKKLNIKDNIHKYVPNFPTEGHKVTIEHLLTHTSGIANYTEDPVLIQTEIQVPQELDALLIRFAEHPMKGRPGEAMQYSNTGYVLLGKIIEVASGISYSDFIEKKIFKKLGMSASRYAGNQLILNRVSGYDMGPQGPVNALHTDMSWAHAAGSLLSTASDLNIWFKALRSGKLITQESYKKMITPFKLNNDSLSHYGFGLMIEKINKYDAVSHAGAISGFISNAVYLPKEDLYIAVLQNSSSGNPFLISRHLIAAALNLKLPTFKTVNLNESAVQPLLGRYKLKDINWEGRFFMSGGKLYTQQDKGYSQEVLPMSNNSFYYKNSLSYFIIEKNNMDQYEVKLYSDLSPEPIKGIKQ